MVAQYFANGILGIYLGTYADIYLGTMRFQSKAVWLRLLSNLIL